MQKRIPKALTNLEILRILRAIYKKKYNGKMSEFNKIRNITMFSCSLFMGLRPREVFNAKIKNLDFSRNNWFIPRSDNKQRFSDDMPIPDPAKRILLKYLSVRRKYYPDSAFLFPTRSRQGRIDRSYYDKLFRDAQKQAGIYKIAYVDKAGKKRALHNPYSCRHTFCTKAYIKLRDLKKVAILARHKDIAMRTTSLYIHCIEDNMRSDIMQDLYRKI